MLPFTSIVNTIIIGGIAYAVYFFEKKYKIIQQIFEKNGGATRSPSTDAIKEEFKEEFVEIAKEFEFQYDELHSMVARQWDGCDEKYLDSAIMEWELKVRINSQGAVANAWNELVSKYFDSAWFADVVEKKQDAQKPFLLEWYSKIMQTGIQQDDRRKIVVQDYSIHHYYIINEVYKIGDTLAIERPCWLLHGKCIEKGIANISKNI